MTAARLGPSGAEGVRLVRTVTGFVLLVVSIAAWRHSTLTGLLVAAAAACGWTYAWMTAAGRLLDPKERADLLDSVDSVRTYEARAAATREDR